MDNLLWQSEKSRKEYIVKPGPKTQTPKAQPQPSQIQSKSVPKGLTLTLKSYGPPTTPPHPQLLSMKEYSSKKGLIVKVAQNDPLDSSSKKNLPGVQQDQVHEVVLHVQEEVYQSTLTLKRRIAGDQEWFVSLSHPGSVLTGTYSRTIYESLGLTLQCIVERQV